MRGFRLVILALLVPVGLALLAGCDRNTEDFVEGEKPRSPDLARIFPEQDPSASRPGAAPQMPAAPSRGAPPVRTQAPSPPSAASASASASASAASASSASASGETISGTISVAPELAGSLPAQGMLFVIARAGRRERRAALAVLRIPSPHFPLAFEIGPANVMIPSMRFQGDIQITARLDGDGNAMTRAPGDVSGATREPHRPGAKAVSIVLDEKL